ncbi:MAG: hypothetical protein ACTSR8_19380 [Promethearchaeota archaeon]
MENIWDNLLSYQIPKISNILLNTDTNEFHYDQTNTSSSNWNRFTKEYLDFCLNINKIIGFLATLKTSEDSLDTSPINASFNARRINLDFIGKCESIIIFLATTLEIYLESIFRAASGKFELNNLDTNDLNKYYYRFYITPNSSLLKLNETLKDRMDFQIRDNLKIAFKLIGLHLPSIGGHLWQEIFDTNRAGSLMRLRHRIVHNGLQVMKDHSFSFNDVYELTMKSIEFIHMVEVKRKELHLQDSDIVLIFDSF